MKQKVKMAFSIFFIGIPGLATFLYLYIYGNPILRHSIGLKEQVYAEKKYGVDVNVVETSYNYKASSYEATLKPIDSASPAFLVYQDDQPGGKKRFKDTYREAMWEKDIKDYTKPVIKKIFPDAQKIKIVVPIGSQYSLPDGQIPPYIEMETVPYQMELTIGNDYQESENSRIYNFIAFLKKNNMSFGTVLLKYPFNSIFIDESEWSNIKTENDITKFVN